MSSLTMQSPGLQTNEIDLTQFIGTVGMSAAAHVMGAQWGYVDYITSLANANDLVSYFGRPTDANHVSWMSAQNFLSYSGRVDIVRVIDEAAKNSDNTGAGILIRNTADYISLEGVVTGSSFAARCAGSLGNSLTVHVCDANSWDAWDDNFKNLFDSAPSTSPMVRAAGGTNDEIHILVIDERGQFEGRPNQVLERWAFLSKARDAVNQDNQPNFYKNFLEQNSKYIYALDMPNENLATGKGVEDITIIDQGVGYVDPVATIVGDGEGAAVQLILGTGVDVGKIVDVKVLSRGHNYTTATINVTDSLGTDFEATVELSTLPSDPWGSRVLNTDGTVRNYVGLTSALNISLVGGEDSLDIGAQELILGWNMFENSEETDVSLLITGDAGGEANHIKVQQHVIDNIALLRKDCVACVSPPLSAVLNKTPNEAATNIELWNERLARATGYEFKDDNWKQMYDVFNDRVRWIPCNSDSAGLLARTDNQFAAWWSPAGLNRGLILNCIRLAQSMSKPLRDRLYRVSINSIYKFRGVGFVLWGDRTGLSRDSAFRSIGIRRLFILLRKSIGRAAQYSLFDFNDRYTRNAFKNSVEPYLRTIQGLRGITDFKVFCDENNNTAEVIQRQEMVASILIKPNYSINFITLNLVAVNQSANFTEEVRRI